jgi:hypothetical protein
MGKKLLLIMLFALLALLIAGNYGIIPSPWIEQGTKTMAVRDHFVNKSAKALGKD